MKAKFLLSLFGAAMMMVPQLSQAAIIADSVADFSNVQGQGNWTYNTSAGGGTQLPNYSGSSFFGLTGTAGRWYDGPDLTDPYTNLWASGGHPSSAGDLAVRTWTSPITGIFTVTGSYEKLDNGGGDGSVVAIAKNVTPLGSFPVANGSPAGNYSYTVPLVAGDKLNFAIGRGGNVFNDATTFTAQIATDPNIISLNFSGGNEFNNGGPYSLAPSAAVGVVPASNFNDLPGNSGTQAGLLNQSGANSGATATWASNGNFSASLITNTGGNDTLLKGHLDGRASGFGPPVDPTVTVSSLPSNIANGLYDVYVYFAADGNAVQSNYTIGSQTFYANPANTFSGAFVQATSTTPGVHSPGTNYVLFHNLTGSSFTLTADSESFRAEISGLQIVPVSAVPEPTSFAMLAFGAVTLFLFRRGK